MNFIFSNLEDLFCGFFFIYNSNIFIYLKQKILENIFYFISNNPIIILTHGEKILNLKVQGQIWINFSYDEQNFSINGWSSLNDRRAFRFMEKKVEKMFAFCTKTLVDITYGQRRVLSSDDPLLSRSTSLP